MFVPLHVLLVHFHSFSLIFIIFIHVLCLSLIFIFFIFSFSSTFVFFSRYFFHVHIFVHFQVFSLTIRILTLKQKPHTWHPKSSQNQPMQLVEKNIKLNLFVSSRALQKTTFIHQTLSGITRTSQISSDVMGLFRHFFSNDMFTCTLAPGTITFIGWTRPFPEFSEIG